MIILLMMICCVIFVVDLLLFLPFKALVVQAFSYGFVVGFYDCSLIFCNGHKGVGKRLRDVLANSVNVRN